MIEVSDWDELVVKTYSRSYKLQQQDGCQSRGVVHLSVPAQEFDRENGSVPEIVNHDEMGVTFEAWLGRDPKKPLADGRTDYALGLWWDRNFYPDISMVANDLYKKGLLNSGKYTINIDW